MTATTLRATWTFERGVERLELRRDATDAGDPRLVITGQSGNRAIAFTTLEALVTFQQDMESFLVRTAWRLVAFEPERRTGRDRRSFPRIEVDRRRWWTDVWSATDPIESGFRRMGGRDGGKACDVRGQDRVRSREGHDGEPSPR